LQEGVPYLIRVEAQNHPAWVIYSSRSNSPWISPEGDVGGDQTQKPIAVAGLDFSAIVGTEVTLNGSHSIGAMTYTWTQTAGTSVTLTGADSATPSFTPSVADTYTFELVVNNGAENSFPDAVTVSAVDAGTEEAAIATTFQNLNAAFQAYIADPSTENMDAIMAYFSASFLEDGMDLADMRAEFEEFLPYTTLFQMTVSNIQVDGTSATGVVTQVMEKCSIPVVIIPYQY